MRKLRGFIPTTLMVVTLMLSTTVANAGIIVGGRADTNPCEKDETTLKDIFSAVATFATTGIIIGGRNGIIVGGRNGIIVGGQADGETCGIIVGG